MATEEAIAAGLIDWINSLAVADPLYTVDDFTNGDLIWKALRALAFLPWSQTPADDVQNKLIGLAFLGSSQKTLTQTNG